MRLIATAIALTICSRATGVVGDDGDSTSHFNNDYCDDGGEPSCPAEDKDEEEEVGEECTPYDPLGPSVVFRDSRGRLGNWMAMYQTLLAMQIR